MTGTDSALLVMDVQEELFSRYGLDAVLEHLRRATDTARLHGVLVVYVKVEFRPGYPEISAHNRNFSQIAKDGRLLGPSQIHPAITPRPGDIEVIKKRVSAFSGSDLDLILRARGIQTLILTGIITSGVVLSTLRVAADMDYRLVVLEDCCLDPDPDLHQVLVDKVFPRHAEVLDLQSWEQHLVDPSLSDRIGR